MRAGTWISWMISWSVCQSSLAITLCGRWPPCHTPVTSIMAPVSCLGIKKETFDLRMTGHHLLVVSWHFTVCVMSPVTVFDRIFLCFSIEFDRDCDYFAIAGVTKKIKVFEYGTVIQDAVDIHYPVNEMTCNSKIRWRKLINAFPLMLIS